MQCLQVRAGALDVRLELLRNKRPEAGVDADETLTSRVKFSGDGVPRPSCGCLLAVPITLTHYS